MSQDVLLRCEAPAHNLEPISLPEPFGANRRHPCHLFLAVFRPLDFCRYAAGEWFACILAECLQGDRTLSRLARGAAGWSNSHPPSASGAMTS